MFASVNNFSIKFSLDFKNRKDGRYELSKNLRQRAITLPVEIRGLLGLTTGDKVLFFQKQDGEIVLSNTSAKAIRKAQATFAGTAEDMGVFNEDEVQALVDEVRYGKDK